MDFRIYDLGFLQNYWRVTIPLSIFACLVADFPRCIENRNNCTVISIRNIYYSIYIMNLLHSILWYYCYVKKKKKLYHITNIENIKKLLKNSGLERNENKTRNQKKKKKNSRYLSALLHKLSYINFIHSFVIYIQIDHWSPSAISKTGKGVNPVSTMAQAYRRVPRVRFVPDLLGKLERKLHVLYATTVETIMTFYPRARRLLIKWISAQARILTSSDKSGFNSSSVGGLISVYIAESLFVRFFL